MIFKILIFGFLLCALAQDQIVGSGSGDSQPIEGSGESIVTPEPIDLIVNSSTPETRAERSNSSSVKPENRDGNMEVNLPGESIVTSEPIDLILNSSTPETRAERSNSSSVKPQNRDGNMEVNLPGESIVASKPIDMISNSSIPESRAEASNSTSTNENRDGKIEADLAQSSGESSNETNVTLLVADSMPSHTTQSVDVVTERTVGSTGDYPTPSYFQDNQQEGNSTLVPTKAFRLSTVEAFELSAAEGACVVTAYINRSVPSVQWIHDEAEIFTEAATRIVLESRQEDWKIKYVAPSPYRSSVGLKTAFYFSKCGNTHSNNESCCLHSPSLMNILIRNKKQLESTIAANITEIHIGLPEEMLILAGLSKPPTWDNYTKAAAASVIAAAFLSVMLGLAIACTRGRKREQKFFKEAAYPVDLGRNLASDDECKSSEYIISNVECTVSKSIPDPDDEECTWVVPIGEIHQAQGSGEVEDTKL